MPVPLSSPVAAIPPPPVGVVGKRARVSAQKKIHAKELEQQLDLLRDLYGQHHRVSELREILDQAIDATHRLSESTRQADYDLVLKTLHIWDVIELGELLEETRLSRWVLDEIIGEFKEQKIVRVNFDYHSTGDGGRPKHLFLLTSKGRKLADERLGPQIKN